MAPFVDLVLEHNSHGVQTWRPLLASCRNMQNGQHYIAWIRCCIDLENQRPNGSCLMSCTGNSCICISSTIVVAKLYWIRSTERVTIVLLVLVYFGAQRGDDDVGGKFYRPTTPWKTTTTPHYWCHCSSERRSTTSLWQSSTTTHAHDHRGRRRRSLEKGAFNPPSTHHPLYPPF